MPKTRLKNQKHAHFCVFVSFFMYLCKDKIVPYGKEDSMFPTATSR